MTGTILRISWINLVRDRVALALTFVLPVVFFSVFVGVFGGLDSDAGRAVTVSWSEEESTPMTRELRSKLDQQPSVRVVSSLNPVADPAAVLRSRDADVVVHVPARSSTQNGFHAATFESEIVLYANEANPLAVPIVRGSLEAAAFALVVDSLPVSVADALADGLIRTRVEHPVTGGGKRPSVAFFAAGIGVLFLLFSLSGRSAILIEERESGVLDRLLASRLSLAKLLFGRWMFLVLLGFAQIVVMFVWAAVAFGLELFTPRHLIGFTIMTLFSACAAASFGLMLAAACRTRMQMSGVASVAILVMSALGGSLFPRFLMPEAMQQIGRFTLNAWAIDGYQKVFWYESAPAELWLECVVLGVTCLVLTAIALMLASRSARRIT